MAQADTGLIEGSNSSQSHITPMGSIGPIGASERIKTLDVLRGGALLGILMVNMASFSLPFAEFAAPNLAEVAVSERLAWAFVSVFFQFKFISLFSLLFGAGLIVQMLRMEQRGQRFVPLYLRRLFVLAIFGLAHGLLLWYGDILFIYACVGVWLMIFRWVSPRAMLITAGVILTILSSLQFLIAAGLLLTGQGSQNSASQQPFPATASAVSTISDDDGDSSAAISTQSHGQAEHTGDAPAHAQADALPPDAKSAAAQNQNHQSDADSHAPARPSWLAAMVESRWDYSNPIWVQAETRAYKYGPFADALGFRAVTVGFAVLGATFWFGWHVLAMFFIGAALMKLRFFSREKSDWHRRLMIWGLGLGVPIEVIATGFGSIGLMQNHWGWNLLAGSLHEIGSATMCLGIVGGVSVAVGSGLAQRLTNAIAAAGRMALTNYLMQTIVVTGLMYWWGLGWFGDVSRVQQIGLAVSIYIVQVIASVLWFRIFAIGPAEWLWRSLTYLKLQPILQRPLHP